MVLNLDRTLESTAKLKKKKKKQNRARSRDPTSLQQTVIIADYILLGKIRDHEFMLIKSSCRIN